MSWKQFLKPNLRKIVLFVVLSIFIYVVYFSFIEKLNLYEVENTYIAIIFNLIFLLPQFILGFINFIITLYYSKSLTPQDFGILKTSPTVNSLYFVLNIVGWILNLFYWYILSCFLVWIYDKYFKKVKKK